MDEEKRQLEIEKNKFEKTKPVTKHTQMSIDLLKPVMTRMRNRIKEIQKLSQAKHEKIMRGSIPQWITTPPEMFISQLKASMSNGVCKISYYVYDKEKDNKKLTVHMATVIGPDGKPKEVEASANYTFEKLVVETIEYMKPTKVEEFKENE